MIAFMLAIAVTVSATAAGQGGHAGGGKPCALSRTCVEMRQEGDDIRLSRSLQSTHDRKMEAYNITGKPCRIIGGQRCPGKGRQIWRLGEPLRQTIARSFGLD